MSTRLTNGVYTFADGESDWGTLMNSNLQILDNLVGNHGSTVSFSQTLTSGVKIGKITINGTDIELYHTDYSGKADATSVYTKTEVNNFLEEKADALDLTSHTDNDDIHVTTLEKETWTNKQDALTDEQLENINSISELDEKYISADDTTIIRLKNDNEVNLQEDHYNAWFGYRGGEVTNWKFGNGSLGGLADVYANDFYLNDESLSDILDDKANTDEVYTKTEVDTKIADLVDSAPEALDTLNELANALDNDPNFATTILSLIGSKVSTSDLANYLPITTTFESLATNSIPFHNAYPRCKYLGTSISSDQNTAIKNRTYDDLFIGDYWTINGINWRIVAIDYYYNIGDTNFDKGNIIVMPDIILYSAPMNNTDTTAGAYAGSLMRTQNLNSARTIAQNAFGSHLANHRIVLTDTVDEYGTNNWAFINSDGIELPNEVQIFGTRVWGSALKGFDVGTQKQQFPLMLLAPQFINTRETYWLQDVSSWNLASYFAFVNSNGFADSFNASQINGVRPAVTLTYI